MLRRSSGVQSRQSSRAQSAMIGFVILIGMVAAVSTGIFLVAGETVTSLEQSSEQERVETAFVELSQQMSTASSNTDVLQSMDLEVGNDGAIVKKDTGNITVSSEALDKDIDLTIGTIEYEGEDGTILAYQAGSVFRETGNETRVISSPPIYYEKTTETLTLPVVTVSGEQDLGTGGVGISHEETTTFRESAVVENESVTITVESEYYRGWESYFEQQAGDTVVRNVDHDNRTVEVRVGYLNVDEAFEDGMVVSENFDDFENADVENGTVREGSMPELDPVIEEMIDDHEDDDSLPTTNGTIAGNKTYFEDEITIDGKDELVVDTSAGNTTIIVDGNTSVEGQLVADPDGSDNELRIYTTGHLDIEGGNVSVTDGNAGQLQLYGTSNTHVGIGPGESSFHGTIYAPRDEPWGDTENEVFHQGQCSEQVCMQSDVDFTGALVASSTNVHSASVSFKYDDELENNEIDLYPDTYTLPPQLTYLNVAHHEVNIDNRGR
ncbi:DUF7289 family protein [Natrialba sp. SSL1]|uniref:DUF7289 family protein n=1 Tax=Natrialba sp. SSL1 TaxID=1869245 RepID=UPI000ACC3CE4